MSYHISNNVPSGKRPFYCDTETTGLSPFNDRVTLFQCAREGDKRVRMISAPDPSKLAALFDAEDRIVMHNSSFDFGMCHYIPRPEQIVDTARLSRLVDFQHEKHTLDKVALRVLGYDPYGQQDKKQMQRTDWSGDLTPDQIRYAETDVAVLRPILNRFKSALTSPIYAFDSQSVVAGLTMQQHGMPILQDEVRAEIASVERDLAFALKRLPLNPNSPKQVCEALDVASSADKILAELELKGHAMAKEIRRARKLGKYLNFLSKIGAEPRYFGTLGPNAASGRFTSSQNNIQQLPRDTKRFVGSRDTVLVAADFAQLELRCIAVLARDKTLVNLFRADEDLHAYTAKQLFGVDYTKEQRQIAKTFNFGLTYGSGAKTVQQMLIAQAGILLSEHEVAQLKRKWLSGYKGIANWQSEGGVRHASGLSHSTPMGRPYMPKTYTQMLAIENQGFGAEIARTSLHIIMDNLPDGAKPINFVHDSVLIECPNDPSIYEPTARVVYDAFKAGWDSSPIKLHGVGMPVEVGVAHNWADADALENCKFIYKGEE